MEGANEYTLKGKGLSIRYSGTSLTGKPVLSVEWKRKKENFQMDRIRTVTSDLGTLVSVDLEATPDRDVIKLVIAIPPVNLNGKPKSIKTLAVVATHYTSIGGPRLVKGPLITYRTVELEGKASHVEP
jgi:hypothetical protein